MSGPFKMKYTGENKSAFPFKGSVLKMFGGAKSSPARFAGLGLAGILGNMFGGGGKSGDEGGGGGGGVAIMHGDERHTGGTGNPVLEGNPNQESFNDGAYGNAAGGGTPTGGGTPPKWGQGAGAQPPSGQKMPKWGQGAGG